MTVKPIDLQINIAQMHEVAKGEQAKTEGVAGQQHILEKESNEKSRLTQSRVDENKKAERTIIMQEEKKKRERRHREKERGKEGKRDMRIDNKIGSIIDVKK